MKVFFVFFFSTFLFAIIDQILNATWAKWYFKYGIPMYKRIGFLKSDVLLPTDAEHIQGIISDSSYTPILVKDLGNHYFAFREKLFDISKANYTPLMHGLLAIDPLKREMKIIGFANFYPIFFALTILSLIGEVLLSSKLFTIIPLIVIISIFVIIFYSIYNVQLKRFNVIYSSFVDSTLGGHS